MLIDLKDVLIDPYALIKPPGACPVIKLHTCGRQRHGGSVNYYQFSPVHDGDYDDESNGGNVISEPLIIARFPTEEAALAARVRAVALWRELSQAVVAAEADLKRLTDQRYATWEEAVLKMDYLNRDNCEICHGAKGGVRGNENRIAGKIVCDYCHADGSYKEADA